MKNLILSIAVAGTIFAVGTCFASSAPTAASLLATVNALQTVDAARSNILSQINLQFAQITEEVTHISSEPRNTLNEQQAFFAELAAVAVKLNQLSTATSIVNQIQETENSIYATLQQQMSALGL